MGPDPSWHLGIFVIEGKQVAGKCLRCNFKWGVDTPCGKESPRSLAPPGGFIQLNQERFSVVTDMKKGSKEAEEIVSYILGIWSGLQPEDLLPLEYIPGSPDVSVPLWTLRSDSKGTKEGPFRSTRKRYGSVRYLSEGGPGMMRPYSLDAVKSREWVIVEGIGDGLAVPEPWITWVLCGTGNVHRMLEIWKEYKPPVVFILTDADVPGKRCGRLIFSEIKKRKGEVHHLVLPPEIKDPAQLGKKGVQSLLNQDHA